MSECTASSPSLVSHVADMATSQLVLSKKLLELEQLLRSLSDHQEVLLAAPAGSPSRGSGAAGAGALPRGGELWGNESAFAGVAPSTALPLQQRLYADRDSETIESNQS